MGMHRAISNPNTCKMRDKSKYTIDSEPQECPKKERAAEVHKWSSSSWRRRRAEVTWTINAVTGQVRIFSERVRGSGGI